MKQIILPAIFAIASSSAVNSFSQTHLDLGIKAGLSIPNLTSGSSGNDVSNGYSSRLDADAAIHAEFHLTKHFSIEPQLEYSSQGGKKDGLQAFVPPAALLQQIPEGQVPAYLYADYKSEAKMNYLMLPILAKYHLNLNKRLDIYLAAGPFASYLLYAKNVTKGSSIVYLDKNRTQPVSPQPISFDSKDDVRDELNNFDAGINGHLGIACRIPNGSLFLEAGGNYGFFDIQKDSKNGKNHTGAAVIDFGFQLKLW